MKASTLIVALAAAARAPLVTADTNATAVALVTSAISSLPTCGQTCITKLPNYASPVNIDVIYAICSNLQNNINSFESCVTSGCTNTTDLTSSKSTVALVPNACSLLGFNESTVSVPAAVIATAATTTKTGAAGMGQLASYLVAAGAVALAYVL
ncbi:hypothetical protein HDU82_008001 [Entophlyctis luteolus]|nr:hypothetical protein HDU82_008001 [Entophlyctis luteolus]